MWSWWRRARLRRDSFMTGTGSAAGRELVDALQSEFDHADGRIAHRLLASAIDADGTVTVVWSAYAGERIYGKTWNVHELRAAFDPTDAETMAGDIWAGEIDEPNGEGHRDAERARALIDDPEDVRWLGLPGG